MGHGDPADAGQLRGLKLAFEPQPSGEARCFT